MRPYGLLVLAMSLLILASVGAPTANAACPTPDEPILCEGEEQEAPEAPAAEPKPVTALRAVVTAHPENTTGIDAYTNAGYTSVELVSTPEAAYETATDAATDTHLKWLTEEAENGPLIVKQPWECAHPHQSFTYVLTARATVGATITTTVHFHAELTARWCTKHKELAEQASRRIQKEEAAERRRTEENERISAETERHRIEGAQKHYEANCRAIGGAPVEIDGGTKIVCRAPNGGVLIVPE